MLHWPINDNSIRHFSNNEEIISNPPHLEETVDTLMELKREGKIRHIGVSNHGKYQMKELEHLNLPFVTNELAYNLLSRAIEDELLSYCKMTNVGVIGYMPLQQGLLTGKYRSLSDVKPMQARSRHFHHSRGEGSRHGEDGAEDEIKVAIKQIEQIAKELDVHIIQLSLAWAIAKEGISTIIAGSRTTDHLKLNKHGANLQLSSEILTRLDNITEPVLRKLGTNPDYYENRKHSRIF